MSLLRVLLENASEKELEWLNKSHEVNKSEHLKVVELESLIEENQIWNGSNHIKDKVAGQVVYRDSLDFLKGSSPLHKVEDNFEKVDDIDGSLNVLKGLLTRVGFVSGVHQCFRVLVLIDIWENNDERSHKHAIDGENGDEEVPDLAEGPLGVDEIPLELWLILIDGAVFVGILVDIINHHFFEVRFSHLLKTSLEPELIVVTSCLLPELFDSFFLLLSRHVIPLGFRIRLSKVVLA